MQQLPPEMRHSTELQKEMEEIERKTNSIIEETLKEEILQALTEYYNEHHSKEG